MTTLGTLVDKHLPEGSIISQEKADYLANVISKLIKYRELTEEEERFSHLVSDLLILWQLRMEAEQYAKEQIEKFEKAENNI